MRVWRMRTGISITLKPADRRRLKALARDRNSPHKHVWRAEIVLLSADGVGTNEIMRRTGKSKTCVWRWQERFMQAGYDGLLRDKTRPSRIPPLGSDIAKRVVALTRTDPPAEATHWTATMMAQAVGISASSVQRDRKSTRLNSSHTVIYTLSLTTLFRSQACCGAHPDRSARRGDPLDCYYDGESRRYQREFRPAHLAHAWSPAAPGPPVQALQRPEVHRQAARCCRALCRSARPCHRPLGRRKVANPGARPHPARPADEERPSRHDDPRLQAPWHNDAVRCSRCPRRQGHWPMYAAPSSSGVHPLLERH